jgi:hypothetical protein
MSDRDELHSVPDVGGIAAIRNRRQAAHARAVRERFRCWWPLGHRDRHNCGCACVLVHGHTGRHKCELQEAQ